MRFLRNVLLFAAILITAQGCADLAARISSNPVERRSAGTLVDDDTIESTAMSRIQEKYKDTAQITVTSYNRFVLITGDATTKEAKTDIERIVYSIPNVKNISNEVSVGGLSSQSVRYADAGITRDVKMELSRNKTLPARTIKFTTDRGVVYLLGFVTHAEAKIASEIASTTSGVQKVVRVFEYID